ncbi:JAB domain-containing protein [Sphingomonas jaspsi]|uniref:JAB domain-containing protein n=1 Tax=Sphingomonas jaspsi TaxID=392409 RepID=UPI0004AF4616|nr:JAB domain-containing protein [Sphingomonas jaspsi]
MQFQRVEPPALLDGFASATAFFSSCFEGVGSARERLVVAHVDHEARCIGLTELDGDADQVDVPLRQILGEAIELGSAALVLAHNHPSGDTTPSQADCAVTRRLAVAGEAMDLSILDHLIFGRNGDCRSMRQMGLL